jgi:hypothetical protein
MLCILQCVHAYKLWLRNYAMQMLQVIKSWWDKATVARYREKAECLGDYYHSFEQQHQHVHGALQYCAVAVLRLLPNPWTI